MDSGQPVWVSHNGLRHINQIFGIYKWIQLYFRSVHGMSAKWRNHTERNFTESLSCYIVINSLVNPTCNASQRISGTGHYIYPHSSTKITYPKHIKKHPTCKNTSIRKSLSIYKFQLPIPTNKWDNRLRTQYNIYTY